MSFRFSAPAEYVLIIAALPESAARNGVGLSAS